MQNITKESCGGWMIVLFMVMFLLLDVSVISFRFCLFFFFSPPVVFGLVVVVDL